MEEFPYDRLSSLSCNFRNNLDSKFCNQLNPDKIRDFNIYFDKNKFSLTDQISKHNNISIDQCASIALKNNYAGFTYNNDKNDCFLSSSKKNDDYTNSDKYANYKINKYNKNKSLIDIENLDDQYDSSKYFSYDSSNENNKFNNDIFAEYKNITINECMKNCINNSDLCKSLFITESPSTCIFYKNKIMKNNKINNEFDSYTIKKNNYIKELNENIDSYLIKNNSKGIFCKIDDDNYTCISNLDKTENENKNKILNPQIPWDKKYIINENFENKYIKNNNNI